MNLKNALSTLKSTPEWTLLTETDTIEELLPKLKKSWSTFDSFTTKLFTQYKILYKEHMVLEQGILISTFPEYFLSESLSESELTLLNSAKILNASLMSDTPDFEQMAKKALTFSLLYKEWADNDKIMQLNFICEIFNGYQQTLKEMDGYNLTDVEKQEYTAETHIFLNKVLTMMKILDSDWKNTLNQYIVKNIDYDAESHAHMHKYLQAIFWENITLELNVKQNFKIMNFLIQDYINIANNLVVDVTSLIDYPCIKNTDDVIALLKIFMTINKHLDSEFPYNTDIQPKNIIRTLQTLFSRLEFLIQ